MSDLRTHYYCVIIKYGRHSDFSGGRRFPAVLFTSHSQIAATPYQIHETNPIANLVPSLHYAIVWRARWIASGGLLFLHSFNSNLFIPDENALPLIRLWSSPPSNLRRKQPKKMLVRAGEHNFRR